MMVVGFPSWVAATWRRLRSRRYRSASAISDEALQNRVDVKAMGGHPLLMDGSHEWMTYRQRDRH